LGFFNLNIYLLLNALSEIQPCGLTGIITGVWFLPKYHKVNNRILRLQHRFHVVHQLVELPTRSHSCLSLDMVRVVVTTNINT